MRAVFLIPILLMASVLSFAQAFPSLPSAGSGPITNFANLDSREHLHSAHFLSGKVIVEGGAVPAGPVTIQSNCNGNVHTAGYTDSKGYFSLEWGGVVAVPDASEEFRGSSAPVALKGTRDGGLNCELQAELPGFTSETVTLAGLSTDGGTANVGTIFLHPLTHEQAAMISATSVAAPRNAQKNFNKGREEEQKGKWAAARESFEKAIREYPRFALAWLELGRVQIQLGNITDAQLAFHEALAADSKLVMPYAELAQIAARQQHWQDAVDATDQLLALDPIGFPQGWFLNSASNYYLGRVDRAEKSALQGLRVDAQHRLPRLHFLLGAILALKHDYHGAAEHLRNYLQLAPHAEDALMAQQKLQQLEKQSSQVATQTKIPAPASQP